MTKRRTFGRARRLLRPAAVLLVAVVALTATAGQAGASTYPVTYSLLAGFGGVLNPSSPPPGANNFACRSAAHPRPVVLVHGTFANQNDNWATLSPLLANNGYCVFTFNFGGPPILGTAYAVTDIAGGARALSSFVDQVRVATGATKVDLVGHSQGGMMPRYYLKFLGGGPKVANLVALAPSNHGTTLGGLVTLANLFGLGSITNANVASLCQACVQQEVGSAFLTNLNQGGDTVTGVKYTVISTKYDEVVTPYTSQFLSGSNVTNITIQNQCALDFDGHAGLAFDHIALRDVLNALDPAHAQAPTCSFVPFDLGG